jgi:hypothetical protein
MVNTLSRFEAGPQKLTWQFQTSISVTVQRSLSVKPSKFDDCDEWTLSKWRRTPIFDNPRPKDTSREALESVLLFEIRNLPSKHALESRH